MPRKARDKELSAKAAAIARKAWEVPSTHVSSFRRVRLPTGLAAVYEAQSSAERGDTWADGATALSALPELIELVKLQHQLDDPSYIVDHDGVTVVWGQHSAIAPTAVQAILKIITALSPAK